MIKKVVNLDNKPVDEIELPDIIFNIKVFPDIINNYIKYQKAKKRQGTHKTKTRSEIRGGSKKPFSQKGTGNARQGSSKPPHFRGGAISMGPRPRDHSIAMNKKERKLALKCALSEKNQKNEIIIIDSLNLNSHKTKLLSATLNKFNFDSALIVYDSDKLDQNFKRASANIPKLNLLSQSGINVEDLISHEKIFIVQDSVNAISKRLS
jgi:large subunit ribosomal protein L4